MLKDSHYIQYEISAFRKLKPCFHNVNYWNYGDYYGLGAGAHSKYVNNNNETIRIERIKHPKKYLQSKCTIANERKVNVDDIPFEFAVNKFRLLNQWDINSWELHTKIDKKYMLPYLNKAKKEGFIHFDNQKIALTHKGIHFHNDLLELFLTDK